LIRIMSNEKGLTILECILAVFMTTVTVVSLVSMQSLSWTSAGKADYLGRAQGILQTELETREMEIMTVKTTAPVNAEKKCIDNQSVAWPCTKPGFRPTFIVSTSILDNNANVTHTVILRTSIKWPGNINGIKSSMVVAPQNGF
jgi:Tfp pilus assembly protein PilV